MSINNIYPKFISVSPCGEDLYESKSQEQTAQSIANYIKSETNDSKLIGLDGDWGSGKSNAISIIDKKLGNDYHVFIYDAWAHQEDMQRRSFLEELTDNLQKKEIINQFEWKSKLNDLLAKRKTTITSTIPTLNYAIISSILVAFVTPITKTISDSLPTTTSIYYKSLLTASPLIVAIIVWIISSLLNKKNWNLTHLFRIYEKADLKKIVNETISENEPSLREFRDWIENLNKDCQRYVIIVFDNMDRLPEEKIKALWTLIHTFFSSENYSNMWIIVPFDRNHIREAFGKETGNNFEKVNHFINKTFSIIYNISPAILTDWKKLFNLKFAEAFGNTQNEEYDIVRKVFDLYNTSITPRKIIAFINDLVSFKLIWEEKIKLRYIALYVLNKHEIKNDPLSQILNKGFLIRSKFLFTNDDLVSDSIAALLYNVPLERATQVTLKRQIELSIREKKLDELKSYSQNNNFISALEQIEFEEIDINTTVFCLNAIESSIKEFSKEFFQVLWDRLIGFQLEIETTTLEFTETHKTLILKCRENTKKGVIEYLLKNYRTNVPEFSGSLYFSVLSSLENFISENTIQINLNSLIHSKLVSPEIFIDYVLIAKESYKKYKVHCDKKQLDTFLSNKLPVLTNENVLLIKQIVKDYEFKTLENGIESTIENNNVDQQNLNPIFSIYKIIKDNNRKPLPIKLADSKIYELLGEAKIDSTEYYELSAMRIARCAEFSSSGPNEMPILQITDEKFISQIASRIDYYNRYGDLLLNVLTWQQPVLIEILKHISLSKGYAVGKKLNIELILKNFKEIITVIKLTEEEMFTKLNGWHKYLKIDTRSENLINLIPTIEIFESALKIENEITKGIFDISIKCIKEITTDIWATDFKDIDSYNFKLLRLLLENNKISILPDNAFDAYKEALKKIASSNSSNGYTLNRDISSKWHFLHTKSDKVHLQATIKDIRDSFLRTVEINKDKFIFFEPLLREQGDLSDESADVVRRILTPISNDEECLNEIINYKYFYAPIVVGAGNDSFNFIDLLRNKIESQPDNEKLSSMGQSINEGLSNKIKIIFGKYYSPQKKEEFTDITISLKRIIEKEKTLHFKVDNNIVGGEDPHFGVIKNLYVKYSYNDEVKDKIFEEHKWFKLP